ncbi:phosphatidylcholine:ceramide cholinephosphotransferase 2-like isoform X3 [Onthophagus taurus]|uniref:phosphatidylcholine:ceramide cholinephosphotransferase 2-like isoform X3 n=1 Tax=Onthophagus taurus TaxID=166361 RepID=UPI000C20EF91|nr:phosphatidylcholine:ceramide cholinephosphotransferase 2-like isoform X3 [Onthophagus taurus]
MVIHNFVKPVIMEEIIEMDLISENNHPNEMVLEPKFTDYGSIHSADIPQLQQQHITSHPLLTQITPRSVLLPQLEEESKTSKGKNMTQGDLYQRQPLLSNTGRNDNRTTDYYIDEDEEQILHQSSASNGGHRAVEISIPTPIREEPRFPQERCKTVLAFLVCIFSFILTLLALAIIHDKVPDRETYGPLPDVILDNVPVQNWALDVSEYIIIVSVNLMLLCMLFHRHRFIVFRRLFLILSLLYMYRAITMFVTVMPISNKSYYCSPKLNHTTPLVIVQRIATLFSGLGLSVNGKHVFCGDYIYSGHTVILIFSYLFMSEYTPKKLYLLHWLYAAFALVGVAMVQLSHGHYTVDVVIAYYITTRIFWIYHTLANNTSLKQHSPNNYLGRSWWFTFFLYFERNVNHPVPRQWPDWPLPWPRRFLTKSRES